MKTETHLQFAKKICDTMLQSYSFAPKKAFVWGCIEPDFNLFSYLKGWKIRPFFGHNWENSKKFITETAQKIQTINYCQAENMFMLGRFIHYVCDAFTYTHNTGFCGSLYDHTKYEKQLHKVFFERIKNPQLSGIKFTENLGDSIHSLHRNYVKMPFFAERDADHIIAATGLVLNACLSPKAVALKLSTAGDKNDCS